MDIEYLTERLQCSYEDKLECFEFAKNILNLSIIARQEGILALQKEIKKDKYNFPLLQRVATLILDGVDPDLIEKILYNCIVAENHSGKEFLRDMIIFKGMYSIQLGYKYYRIMDIISSYFGIKFEDHFTKLYEEYNQQNDLCIENIVNKYVNSPPMSENTKLFEVYADVHKNAIKQLIPHLDFDHLCLGLTGASGKVKMLFLNSMSERKKNEAFHFMNERNIYETEIIRGQQKIVNVIEELQNSGQLFLRVPTKEEIENLKKKNSMIIDIIEFGGLEMQNIEGGIIAAKGFKSTGGIGGIKKNGKKDLAFIYSEVLANGAGAFTTNVVKAAPVLWDEKILNNKNKIKGIVVNSGNANACTGKTGEENTKLMAQTYAECIGAETEQILVASTGVIGVQLPIEKVIDGIKNITPHLGNLLKDGILAAESIMTTDLVKKEIAIEFEISGKKVRMGGIAKGSGMIHPNMATLLSFITTDINISQELLEKAIKNSVIDSYNMISVDRDTSTNDTVIILANGLAGNNEIKDTSNDYYTFKRALDYLNKELAKSMARDGEGATKFIEMNVLEAESIEKARKIAKSVITSNLTKTAMFGEDANWGRVLCAMGYAGVDFDISEVKLMFSSKAGELVVMEKGIAVTFDEAIASKILAETDITITAEMGEGDYSATAWGCDLSYDYIKINGDYRS